MTLRPHLQSHASSRHQQSMVQVWEQSGKWLVFKCPETDFLFIVTVTLTFDLVTSFAIPCELSSPTTYGPSLGTIWLIVTQVSDVQLIYAQLHVWLMYIYQPGAGADLDIKLGN